MIHNQDQALQDAGKKMTDGEKPQIQINFWRVPVIGILIFLAFHACFLVLILCLSDSYGQFKGEYFYCGRYRFYVWHEDVTAFRLALIALSGTLAAVATTVALSWDKEIPRRPSPWTVAMVFGWPIFSFGLTYIFAPDYIIPSLNYPDVRLIWLALIGWHILGCWLFARTANSMLRKLVIVSFGTVPLVLFPILFSLFLNTNGTAIGPVMMAK
jgi:energy-converting hydrogenase Eha subunit A